jgi:hypothetical protein
LTSPDRSGENGTSGIQSAQLGTESPEKVPSCVPQPFSHPTTPIATDLAAHFAAGGTVVDAIRLVELLELRGQKRKRSSANDRLPAQRGSRLSADWHPTPTDIEFARAKGMHPARVETEAERFRNFWLAKSGAGATKLDWPATWRNWVLRAQESPHAYGNRNSTAVPASGRAPAGGNAVVAGMVRLADSRREARDTAGRGREMASRPDAPRIDGPLVDAGR